MTVPEPTASEPVSVADSIEPMSVADSIDLGAWGELYRIVAEPIPAAKPVVVTTSVSNEGYDGEAVSCLDEEWDPAGCFEQAPEPSSELRVVAELPRDVFTPAPRAAGVPTEIPGERPGGRSSCTSAES